MGFCYTLVVSSPAMCRPGSEVGGYAAEVAGNEVGGITELRQER